VSQPIPAPPGAAVLSAVEEIDLRIDKLVSGGQGLGRYQGVPVFVARTAPGDLVRVRVVERRPAYGRGEIVEILEASPFRRSPPCRHFGSCGGCDLQHIEDGEQVRLKVEATLETLRRLGRLEPPPALEVLSADAWGYRLRTQLHCRADAAGHVEVGYHARGSRELVAISECPILAPELEALAVSVPVRLNGPPPRRLDLAVGGAGGASSAPVVEGLPHGDVSVAVGPWTFEFDARCFFQGHRTLLPALVQAAVGEAEGGEAFDLYCGVGLFTVPLAARYERVIGVEGDRIAARYARRNARRNRVSDVTIETRAIESWIDELPVDAERVVVDPPRQGLSKRVRAVLASRPPRRLTYVSCHPAALARDLRSLGGQLEVEKLVLADLFPQTGHLEAIVQMVRR
jgi:23S rRNA (uracil1939-C5)-methyltransferase